MHPSCTPRARLEGARLGLGQSRKKEQGATDGLWAGTQKLAHQQCHLVSQLWRCDIISNNKWYKKEWDPRKIGPGPGNRQDAPDSTG